MKKIVIIGPESTGKSTLCQQLAQHFNSLWCPEYAREYLLAHGTNYTYDDLLTIAEGQVALEDDCVKRLQAQIKKPAISRQPSPDVPGNNKFINHPSNTKQPLLFIDTDMYVMKVWCDFVFGKCHAYILDQLAVRKYDLYLLCNVDLPWVKDELREYPDFELREKLYGIYKTLLQNQPVPWVNIHGNFEERLHLAIDAINNLS